MWRKGIGLYSRVTRYNAINAMNGSLPFFPFISHTFSKISAFKVALTLHDRPCKVFLKKGNETTHNNQKWEFFTIVFLMRKTIVFSFPFLGGGAPL